jgi:hypothetical protein
MFFWISFQCLIIVDLHEFNMTSFITYIRLCSSKWHNIIEITISFDFNNLYSQNFDFSCINVLPTLRNVQINMHYKIKYFLKLPYVISTKKNGIVLKDEWFFYSYSNARLVRYACKYFEHSQSNKFQLALVLFSQKKVVMKKIEMLHKGYFCSLMSKSNY